MLSKCAFPFNINVIADEGVEDFVIKVLNNVLLEILDNNQDGEIDDKNLGLLLSEGCIYCDQPDPPILLVTSNQVVLEK